MEPTDETLELFEQAGRVVDNLSKHLSKDTVVEIARTLSLQVAQYRRLYGDIDTEAPLTPDGSKSADDEDELLIMASEGLNYLADTMLHELERQKRNQKQESGLH